MNDTAGSEPAGRTLDGEQLLELEARGFTVVPGLIGPELAARARQLVDVIIGSPPPEDGLGLRDIPEGRGQKGPWPADGDDRPVITLGNYRHSISHPIHDAAYGHPGLMAELLTPFVELNRQLLRVPEEGFAAASAAGMKLLQQEIRRTDRSPPPHHGCHAPWLEPAGWHLDQGFLPQHYAAAPRQNFFHTILALSPFTQNGGAFFTVPSSLAQARRHTAAMSRDEQAEIAAVPDRTRTRLREALTLAVDRAEIAELTLETGDLIILDPMVMHSASDVATQTRYALFTSFFHEAAIGTTLTALRAVAAAPGSLKYPADLRGALPRSLRPLLDWELPLAVEEDSRVSVGLERQRAARL
jgi:hypothetical protein